MKQYAFRRYLTISIKSEGIIAFYVSGLLPPNARFVIMTPPYSARRRLPCMPS